jgi:FAD:protein FMN transferase
MGEHRVVEVMGTVFSIDVRDPGCHRHVTDELTRWWQWVDRTFSPFRADSQISRLNRGELRPGNCSPQVLAVRALCRRARRVTHGYFDAHATGRFDPCGLVKGWSIETASAMLTRAGARNHCINGGGDIRCAGQPEPGRPWHVGIADPHRCTQVAATALVGDAAVATSGTAQRGPHVLDPHTGLPATALASVTIVGSSLIWADVYATAAFAMGEQALAWLCTLDGQEGLVIAADGTRRQTPGFPSLPALTASRCGEQRPAGSLTLTSVSGPRSPAPTASPAAGSPERAGAGWPFMVPSELASSLLPGGDGTVAEKRQQPSSSRARRLAR